MRRSIALAAVLSVLSSGCATRRLLNTAAGVDWLDPQTPPPGSRIVPDRIAFCADGLVELHADAFPPPDTQWIGRREVPVRVMHTRLYLPPDKLPPDTPIPASRLLEYRDVREGACGPVAETVRMSLPPDWWSTHDEAPRTCLGGTRMLRDQALSPDATTPVPPEFLDVLPARSIEVVVAPDKRAPLVLNEPRPSAYAALPLAVAGDAVLVGTGTGLVLGLSALGWAGTPAFIAIGVPFLVAAKIQERNAEPRSRNLDGEDLTRESFRSSDALAGASLRCAKLVGVDLRNARLADANLEHTRLVGADLRGADLSSARNLTQRQLDATCVDAATLLPPGLSAPPPCF
jgi:hypothetical protein